MGQKFLANGHKETLVDARARVTSRAWKHYAVSAAIFGGVVLGAGESGKNAVESQNNTSHSTDSGKIGLAALWLTLAGIGGLAGAVVMTPKIVRNQRSLERIDAALNAGETHNLIRTRKSIYQKNADGRYETFGDGHQRVQTKMRVEFASAVGLATTGTALILDTVFSDKFMLTQTIAPLVQNAVTAQNLAGVAEVVTGVTVLAGAAALAFAGQRHEKIRNIMYNNKVHFGADARQVARTKPVANDTTAAEPA